MDQKPGQRAPLAVLVADDIEMNRRLAVLLLGHLGYRVDVAAGGREACEMAMRRAYHLIFMDVQMPGFDGLEATRLLREHYAFGGGPRIVAMTAGETAGDRERCIAAGMDDYLVKPLRPAALLAVVERATSAAALNAAAMPPRENEVLMVLDWARLEELRVFDEGGSLVAEVIAEFVRDAPANVEALLAAHKAGDMTRAASLTHGLKGMAANVGALAMQSLCFTIETGEHATVERATVERALSQLPACVRATCAALTQGPG